MISIKEEEIVKYLKESYNPIAIIKYGSFADGSANENSDFDALVITTDVEKHDSSVVADTVLDVWVYPENKFSSGYDPDEFLQVFDGIIIQDQRGLAKKLIDRVNDYIDQTPAKSDEDIIQEVAWCEKMLARTVREDAEGYYRWHWLLMDSLEIYFDIKHLYYHGPKKALKYMQNNDSETFDIYLCALKEMNQDNLAQWIGVLKALK
ncbi:nucleotidyltransferase domain-containing protein [Butyrivibrio sp. CB08]|uniref:nucleotidyltransferase domain-containing protein n=1 Tax=Butyrivibrio sp. CB08 TaxID=2364879 RepID=UPI000EA86180|nr:nucleotidyltransferase domain-containing protein [Butyrivibrio sp. CB08]RKM59366.1 nucleotidyltransferase domain-containing protein [Butyrivibrio sp. CB08]